nr:DUF4290 domain-containing protein [Prevotella sp.]
MNIEGLDYNTKRERLILPEFGRGLQNMVDYCMTIKDRSERQQCAETIVAIMDRMFPEDRGTENHDHKLWDNLARMSDFKLDIDYPFDVTDAEKIATKPEPMSYPMHKIPVRHYGNMMFEIFGKLEVMEPGTERDELVRITANQMKRNLMQWSHGSCDDEKVASDLAKYTDGKIQLDLSNFKFDEIVEREVNNTGKNKKRK